MEREEIIEKLKVIVKPYSQNQDAYDNLNENTDFIKDLHINSANLVDIILDVEEAFDIVIENTDMEKMLTVKASLDIIESKLASK
jgi:acyl carrier protein